MPTTPKIEEIGGKNLGDGIVLTVLKTRAVAVRAIMTTRDPSQEKWAEVGM